MYKVKNDYQNLSREVFYELLYQQALAILKDEKDPIANMANISALLYHALTDVNWVGFYRLVEPDLLLLGPFQGKPACVRIRVGQGVCGTSAAQRQTLIVPDVHKFDGHIACDSASNSEIVVPMLKGHQLLGVLDIDSPKFDRFTLQDQEGLEKIVNALVRFTDF